MDDLGGNPTIFGNTHKDTLSNRISTWHKTSGLGLAKQFFFFRQLTIGQPFEKVKERDGGFRATAT